MAGVGLRIPPAESADSTPETRKVVERGRAEIRPRGPGQNLAEWLRISWFYPAGFIAEEIWETAEAYWAQGGELTYKFLKSKIRGKTLSVHERFEAARREIRDHRKLAPGLYLGIRLLSWVDGAPEWLEEIPGDKITESKLTAQAHEVVLVLRRVTHGKSLEHFFLSEGEVEVEQIDLLFRMLAGFHRRQQRRRSGALGHPSKLATQIRRRLAGSISEFVTACASSLDPYSRTALQECSSFLNSQAESRRQLFLDRAEAGLVIDGHGALKSENIFLVPPYQGAPEVCILNRVAHDGRRVDLLEELAQLTVDLEVQGQHHLALELEQRYRRRLPKVFCEDSYRFYLVLQAITMAIEYFERSDEISLERMTVCLSLAIRYTYALRSAFGVLILGAVSGSSEHEADWKDTEQLAVAVAELGNVQHLDRSTVMAELPGYNPLDDTLFQRLLLRAADELSDGRPVVVRWPCNEEQAYTFQRLFDRYDAPWIVVRCEGERSGRNPAGSAENGTAPVNPMIIEPMLPQPELALHVFGALSRRARRRG